MRKRNDETRQVCHDKSSCWSPKEVLGPVVVLDSKIGRGSQCRSQAQALRSSHGHANCVVTRQAKGIGGLDSGSLAESFTSVTWLGINAGRSFNVVVDVVFGMETGYEAAGGAMREPFVLG